MRRRVFTFAAALSLLLCVATVVLWVRSYSGADSVSRMQVLRADALSSDSRIDEVQWTRGQMRIVLRKQTLYFQRNTPGTGVVPPPHWSFFRYGPGFSGERAPNVSSPSLWNRLGFATWVDGGWSSSFASSHHRTWAVPLWLMMTLFAAGPALGAVRRYFRRRRREAGRCAACGYDLRASPERCPECGTVSHGGAAAA